MWFHRVGIKGYNSVIRKEYGINKNAYICFRSSLFKNKPFFNILSIDKTVSETCFQILIALFSFCNKNARILGKQWKINLNKILLIRSSMSTIATFQKIGRQTVTIFWNIAKYKKLLTKYYVVRNILIVFN